jgi:hypothetical protein
MPLLLIIVALIPPLAWIVFEFRRNAVARRICGALTIASACLIGWGAGMLQQLNYNAWYGQASKRLLEGVAATLPPGSPERKMAQRESLWGENHENLMSSWPRKNRIRVRNAS